MTALPLALGISASAPNPSCVLRLGDGSLVPGPTEGRSGLAWQVDRLLRAAGHEPTELGELRVDVGPGSYTGLRVAVTFARTLSAFGGVPVRIATSVELMALTAWSRGLAPEAAPVRIVLDARRNRYCAALVRLSPRVVLDEPPRAIDEEALLQSIAGGEVVLAEPRLHELLQPTATLRRARIVAPAPYSATGLFDDRLETRRAGADDLAPLYLMASYAG